MTALSNFSLSVEDSKVSNMVLPTVNLTDQKLSVSLIIYLSWYWTWDPWGLCCSQTQLQADARQIVLSCYAASRKQQQQQSQNDAVQKQNNKQPPLPIPHQHVPLPPSLTARMLPGEYLETGNIPSNSLSQFGIHADESLPSPGNSNHLSKESFRRKFTNKN